MTGGDLLGLAWENVRRHRLRVAFTVAGVAIAVATSVALLAFAAGSHRWVNDTFAELGLLTSMNVYPRGQSSRAAVDTTAAVPLDRAAVADLRQLPGVRYAYPFVDFAVTASVGDSTLTTRARALPPEAFDTDLFHTLLAGHTFGAEDAAEAVVSPRLAEQLGLATPDDLVGRTVVLATRVASLDSALAAVVGTGREHVIARLAAVPGDSLLATGARERVLRRELVRGMSRFMEGLFGRQRTVRDTLTVIGLMADPERYQAMLAPVVVPVATGRRFASAGINLGSDPAMLLGALRGGTLLSGGGTPDGVGYPQVTLELERFASHEAVRDSVQALGFEAFSYAESFAEVQRFHLYFYVGLGVIGGLALLTAALGIANTLVMSVTERRREIGVLKSLGADDGDIRGLFLTEAALIGTAGSLLGLALGWLGTRVASVIIQALMSREGLPLYEPFALPLWLALLAPAFGVLVAVAAGTFPAGRAARVDPVNALRGD